MQHYKKFIRISKGEVPYTYTSRQEKTVAYILKGLHEDVDEEDIGVDFNEIITINFSISHLPGVP